MLPLCSSMYEAFTMTDQYDPTKGGRYVLSSERNKLREENGKLAGMLEVYHLALVRISMNICGDTPPHEVASESLEFVRGLK